MFFDLLQTDTFFLEAVHLGDLYKIIVGHDGLGPGKSLAWVDIQVRFHSTHVKSCINLENNCVKLVINGSLSTKYLKLNCYPQIFFTFK